MINLLNDNEDRNKDGTKLYLLKYPSLTTEDIEGHWKNWSLQLEKYFIEYFGYENPKTLFYEKALMHIVGCIFGDIDFPENNYQKDVTETIEYIKMQNDVRDIYE